MESATIVDRNGTLYVRSDPEPAYDKPEMRALLWPLGAYTRDCPDFLVNARVSYLGEGRYRVATPGGGSHIIYLPQGGKTVSAGCETQPIKPPRKRRDGQPWTWRRGQWTPGRLMNWER